MTPSMTSFGPGGRTARGWTADSGHIFPPMSWRKRDGPDRGRRGSIFDAVRQGGDFAGGCGYVGGEAPNP